VENTAPKTPPSPSEYDDSEDNSGEESQIESKPDTSNWLQVQPSQRSINHIADFEELVSSEDEPSSRTLTENSSPRVFTGFSIGGHT